MSEGDKCRTFHHNRCLLTDVIGLSLNWPISVGQTPTTLVVMRFAECKTDVGS